MQVNAERPNQIVTDQTDAIISIVRECICRMYDLPEFQDVAFANVASGAGRERELYPYLNVLLLDAARARFGGTGVRGIGGGELAKKQPDCLLVLTRDTCVRVSAIEIKGPSKDLAHVKKGQEADTQKLQELVNTGLIDLGVSVALFLDDPGNPGTSITRNGKVTHVRMEIKKTEPVTPADAENARRG